MSISGLKIEDIVIGKGESADKGSVVSVSLVLSLNRGDVVYRSDSHEFEIGSRQVIAGLEKSVVGMRLGGERRVRLSPHLAYGKEGLPDVVPPDAVLIAEIKLNQIL